MTDALATASRSNGAQSATELVFETILADIVRGVYPPGARLPAERELARILGASRPTLREALRRLAEWQLVEARRGSGVVVRAKTEWSIEVLPAYLRFARPDPDEPKIGRLMIDLLDLRRAMIREMARIIAGRIPAGHTREAREACANAWALRGDAAAFPVADFAVMRSVAEAAQFLPAVWFLNRLATVYLDIARTLSGTFSPPDDYVEAHTRFFEALEAGDSHAAATIIEDYLQRHDRALVGFLANA